MHTDAAATHAILLRAGRPNRVASLTDWRALSDMHAAAMLSIGLYSIAEVDARAAKDAEDIIAGTRSALIIIASPAWRAALAA